MPTPSRFFPGEILYEDAMHLGRLTFWGLTSVGAGLLGAMRARRRDRARSTMTAGAVTVGAVTAVIGLLVIGFVAVALGSGAPPALDPYRRAVALRLATELAAVLLGAARWRWRGPLAIPRLEAGPEVRRAAERRVTGRRVGGALALQGAVLFALDLALYARVLYAQVGE